MSRINKKDFFTCSSEELAKKLLGKIICRKDNDFTIRCRITVTEAYPNGDPVNDGERAKKNNKKTVQFNNGGILYVKKQRGCYRFDIVAGRQGDTESVLIRGIDGYKEGPFITADALNINERLNGVDLTDKNAIIWIEDDGAVITPNEPTKRVLGEKACKESQEKLLRFSIKEIRYA